MLRTVRLQLGYLCTYIPAYCENKKAVHVGGVYMNNAQKSRERV